MRAKRHPREPERLRALRDFEVLDTEPEALFDELIGLATDLFDVPVALVSLVDEHRQWFKARTGFGVSETSLEESFCAHAILDEGVLIVEDTSADERFADNPLVVASSGSDQAVRFYAGAPLITADGLPLGTLCVLDHRPRRFDQRHRHRLGLLRDQTMALLERRRLQIEADERTRRKSAFLAQVSHEIRTPLAAVLGYAELLDGMLESPDHLTMTHTLLRNGEHLRSIVDQLLDLSRIEAGRLELHHTPCVLESLLGDLDALMRGDARSKGLGWRIECPDTLPVSILTDTLRLRQILINLIGNALKFTDRGEVVLQVKRHRSATGSMTLRFTVRDTGMGLDAVQLDRVFAPFGQGANDTAARFGGSGLGLTIARELAQLLGGTLTAESRREVGSLFRLELPCEPLGTEHRLLTLPGAPVRPARTPDALSAHTLAERYVLLVDDDDDSRYLAARTLERAGADVVAIGGGGRALELLRQGTSPEARQFDVLVLDMQMPGLDGLDVLQAMSTERVDVPVVALTAGALPEQRERCLAAGCRAYVTKPFVSDELVRAVAGVLARGGLFGATPAPESAAGNTPRPAPASTAVGHRVLIVEDSKDLADVLERLLSRNGYEVQTVHTAAAALERAVHWPPDCVLLDRELPDMCSPELLPRLRANASLAHTRFVSLSGTPLRTSEREALDVDLHLIKPVASKALLEALGRLLEALPAH